MKEKIVSLISEEVSREDNLGWNLFLVLIGLTISLFLSTSMFIEKGTHMDINYLVFVILSYYIVVIVVTYLVCSTIIRLRKERNKNISKLFAGLKIVNNLMDTKK